MKPGNEPFRHWVAVSLVLHATLFGAAAFGGLLFPSNSSAFGYLDGGDNSITVKVTDGAPGLRIPRPAEVNPGVKPSDTPGWQPPAPKPPDKKPPVKKSPTNNESAATRPSPKAIPIPDPNATGAKPSVESTQAAPQTTANTGPSTPPPPNAVVSGTGGTAAIMYGRNTNGSGATSVGFSDRAFGDRFGWYASRVTAAVSEYWQPAPGAGRSPKISLLFTINKDGSVTDVEFDQKSNNDALDNSARRAILLAAASKRIPPLPNEFRGSSVRARLFFEYTVR